MLPPDVKVITDPQTGVELRFLTTDPAVDNNLYFHQNSWFMDGSAILFISQRSGGGLMVYLTATGELVCVSDEASVIGGTAGFTRPCVFIVRKNGEVLEVTLDIQPSTVPERERSKVTAHMRLICALPPATGTFEINETCDGKTLAIGNGAWTHMKGPGIVLVDEKTGEFRDLCAIDPALGYGLHLQCSHTDPHMLGFAATKSRLWVVDTRKGVPHNIYREWPGELVTHESWWVNDQILFCGGTHPKPTENADVKALDTHTGIVRVVGAGAWWAGATPEQLAKVNWWHSDGSDDGRWVVADNWHGDIMLFEGTTTRPRLLTASHRTYGKGDHPHVGFDRASKQVIFTSQMLGNSDVCVATVPRTWQDENPAPR